MDSSSNVTSLPPMDGADWRTKLTSGSRQKILDLIFEALKRQFPSSGEEGLQELWIITTRFEGKMYDVATSQSDYLCKISLKILSMKETAQPPIEGRSDFPPSSNEREIPPDNPPIDLSSMHPPLIVNNEDWRNMLTVESRGRIIDKISETLRRHLSFAHQDVHEIAVRFEEKMYTTATSQSDYLRRISMKMLTTGARFQQPIALPNPRSDFPPSSKEREIPSDNPPIDLSSVHPPLLVNNEDWRNKLMLESRGRIINKIFETLRRHLSFAYQQLLDIHKIAVRFEEKMYTKATSQSDYLRRISMKMLTMEARFLQPIALPNPSYRTEIEAMADQIEEKMCSEAMNQQDYMQKLDNLKHAIDEAIMTQHTA